MMAGAPLDERDIQVQVVLLGVDLHRLAKQAQGIRGLVRLGVGLGRLHQVAHRFFASPLGEQSVGQAESRGPGPRVDSEGCAESTRRFGVTAGGKMRACARQRFLDEAGLHTGLDTGWRDFSIHRLTRAHLYLREHRRVGVDAV